MVARGLCTSVFPLLFIRSFARAATVQIDDFDPRITYNTPILSQDSCENRPDNYACAGNWWYELGNNDGGAYNNSIHDTFGPATTATLQFQGSAISVYGVTLGAGAKGFVVIDGGPPDFFSSVSSDGTLHSQQLLYSKGGLNPAIDHQISIAYDESSYGPADNRRWLGIDYFAIDTSSLPSTQTISTSTATGSLSTSSTERSDQTTARQSRSHSKTGVEVTAGGVAGGIALVAIGAAGLFLIRRHFREVDERHLGHHPTPHMAAFAHSTLAASQHIRPYHGFPSSCPDTSWSAPTPFLAPPLSSGPPTGISSSSQLGSETVELVSQPPPYSPVAGSVPLPVDTMINVPEISKLL